ncbi:MAG: extracellular solute-binding protein [Anaerolineae bacterium]
MGLNLLRRTLRLLLACALLVSLGGCALQNQASGPITLRIAYRPSVVDLKPLFETYMRENPGVKIETFELTATNGVTFNQELQEGKLDLVRDFRSNIFAQVRNGSFEALEGWIESSDWTKIRADYYAGSWEGLQVNGRQYGIPAGLDMYVAYVNLDAFEAAFAQPPNADWTIQDLVTSASAVNNQAGTPGEDQGVIYGFGTDYMSADPIIFTYLHGARLLDDFSNPTTAYLNEPLTVEAITMYADLFRTYLVTPEAGSSFEIFGSGGMQSALNQGFCALWFGLFSQRGGGISIYGTPVEWPFKWKMLPLPRDAQAISLGDVDGYYIPANSGQQEAAVKLLRWLADQWQASGTRFPARKSLAADARYQNQLGADIVQIASLAADNLQIVPQFYGRYGGFILSDFYTALFNILVKGEDPQASLDTAQESVQKLILQFQGD